MSKRIAIGRAGGKPIFFDLKLLLRTRALVTANSGGGKSWLLRRMAEELFGQVPVWIIDPEGEFASLREKFGYVLVGKGGETPADVRTAPLVAQKLRELQASAVFDLYDLKPVARHAWVRAFLEALMNLPKSLWRPLVLMLDEAHVFGPEKGQGESEAFGAVQDVATRGRKRGICLIPFTQRLAKISKSITAEMLNRLVGMTREGVDIDRAVEVLSVSRDERDEFRHGIKLLEAGNFWAMGPAIANDRVLVTIGGVQTKHPEVGEEISDTPPPAPDKIKALLPKLADLPKEAEEKARNEADLRSEIRSLKAQLSTKPKHAPAAPASKHDERVVEVPILGKREIAKLEKLVVRIEESKKAYWMTTTSLENATRDIAAVLERLKDGKSTNDLRKSVGLGPVKEKISIVAPLPASPTHKYIDHAPASGLDKCARAVLVVLAQYQDGCAIGKISLLAGYKQSGSFMSTLSSLRTRGYLVGNNSDTMRISSAGIDALGDFAALPVGDELAQYWLRHPSFSLCDRKILETILQDPDGFTLDEICEKTGYSASGSFMSSLSSLRTAGVLVGRNSEKMKAAEDLYG